MQNKLPVFVLFVSMLVSGSAIAQQSPEMTIERISTTVVLIETQLTEEITIDEQKYDIVLRNQDTGEMQDKTVSLFGTGVLIADDNSRTFLITADHVAIETNEETTITFRVGIDQPFKIKLQHLLPNIKQRGWTHHAQSDIAAIELQIPNDLKLQFAEHFLPVSLINKELTAPDRDRTVVTVGFPLGLGADGRFSPISRESKPASGLLTISRFDKNTKQDFFLLDSPSVGGFSGAPVLMMPGTEFSGNQIVNYRSTVCVGIIHGTIADITGGKMAAVTPSFAVYELLVKMGADIIESQQSPALIEPDKKPK